ncbi:hypothetical protein ACOSQ2_018190 [Xanthoceras sorbifolium]
MESKTKSHIYTCDAIEENENRERRLEWRLCERETACEQRSASNGVRATEPRGRTACKQLNREDEQRARGRRLTVQREAEEIGGVRENEDQPRARERELAEK